MHGSARTLAGLCAVFLPSVATALPLVALDLDPATEGIQTFGQVSVGEPIPFEVVIQGVEAEEPLNAFSLEIGFNSSIVAGAFISLGSFLVTPTHVIEESASADTLLLSAATLGSAGASGDGVLAVGSLDAVAVGASAIALRNVVLTQPFGVPIDSFDIQNAVLEVVPEPSTGLLLGGGLAAIALRVARRRRGGGAALMR
jgi:hypothetical protein